MMDGPHKGGDASLRAQPPQGVGRDAVLGMVDVKRLGLVCHHEVVVRLDIVRDALVQRDIVGQDAGRDQREGDRGRAKEARLVFAERENMDGMPKLLKVLGERQRVNHAAARLGRVGEEGNAQGSARAGRRRRHGCVPTLLSGAPSDLRASATISLSVSGESPAAARRATSSKPRPGSIPAWS